MLTVPAPVKMFLVVSLPGNCGVTPHQIYPFSLSLSLSLLRPVVTLRYSTLILPTPGEDSEFWGSSADRCSQLVRDCSGAQGSARPHHNYRLGTTDWTDTIILNQKLFFKRKKYFFRDIEWNRLFTKLILSWILKQVNCADLFSQLS